MVGEIADHVVVMRNGEIREQGAATRDLRALRRTRTRRRCSRAARALDRRPTRLPVIDDFMDGTSPRTIEERTRGTRPATDRARGARLGKSFYSREGLFGKREFQAVKDVSFKLPKGKTLGLVGESGSGKTTRRAHRSCACTRRPAARCCSKARTC